MNRTGRIIFVLILLFACCGITAGGALLVTSGGNPVETLRLLPIRLALASRSADLQASAGTSTEPVRFAIEAGDSPAVIAGRLQSQGLIRDADLFVDYARLEGIDRQLQAGVYFLNPAMPLVDIAAALTDSSSSQIPFRILEGWRAEEIGEVIDQNPLFGFSGDDFLQVIGPGAAAPTDLATEYGIPVGSSLEGFLFPNTYQLPAETTPDMLRDYLLREFADQVGPDAAAAAAAQGYTLFDLVRLASIVQREAVRVDEMPQIASVYRNRLAAGMRLEADPTVQYALGSSANWWPMITQADYTNAVSPFNTYLNAGLPPTAIANPGLAAITAAIYPADTPYLYFRARCDGSGYHAFAVTFEEHVANGC